MPPKPQFEELDFRETPLGDLILRRRTVLSLDNLDVYEIILGEAFLMSSLFTSVEIALADLGLAAASTDDCDGESLDVVVQFTEELPRLFVEFAAVTELPVQFRE